MPETKAVDLDMSYNFGIQNFSSSVQILGENSKSNTDPGVDRYPFLSLPCTHSRAPQGREQSSPAAWPSAPTAAACAPALPCCSAACTPTFPAAAPHCPAPTRTAPCHHRASVARSHRCRPRTDRLPRSASLTVPLHFPRSRLLSHPPAHLLLQCHLSPVLCARTLHAPRRCHGCHDRWRPLFPCASALTHSHSLIFTSSHTHTRTTPYLSRSTLQQPRRASPTPASSRHCLPKCRAELRRKAPSSVHPHAIQTPQSDSPHLPAAQRPEKTRTFLRSRAPVPNFLAATLNRHRSSLHPHPRPASCGFDPASTFPKLK